MEFEPQYTEEQERFRVEFAQWLDENVPPGMEEPAEPADLTLEQYQKQRELGRRLGERGWLWPTAPQSYGGGGLDIDDAIIIEEEMDTRGLYLPPYYDSGGRLGGNTVLVWGSEEQKLRLLPRQSYGEKCALGSFSPNRKPGPIWPVFVPTPSGMATATSSMARRYTSAATTELSNFGLSSAPTPMVIGIRT